MPELTPVSVIIPAFRAAATIERALRGELPVAIPRTLRRAGRAGGEQDGSRIVRPGRSGSRKDRAGRGELVERCHRTDEATAADRDRPCARRPAQHSRGGEGVAAAVQMKTFDVRAASPEVRAVVEETPAETDATAVAEPELIRKTKEEEEAK